MSNGDQQGTLDRRDFLRAAGGLGAVLGLGGVARAEASPHAGDEITGMDALSLSAAIHARRVSCGEVMHAYLSRIARLNPRFNAIVSLRPEDELLVEARACDAELAAGRSRGWMHGFPHAVKDLADVKGLPTSRGSPIFRGAAAAADSVFVERLRAAGAIFIGKTNTPEFCLGSQTYNPVFGVTRNAWDPSRTAGGSSGGACVALALRMLPVADGSDMMGSLRNPAGWNNVIGFRPSQGRIPREGPAWFDQLGTGGPMARTVPEAARLLATMAGFDPRDPMSLGEDPSVYAGSLGVETRGLRVGWLGDLGAYLPMEAGVIPLCERALQTAVTLGGHVEAVDPPFPPERLWKAWLVLRHWSVATWGAALYRDPRLRAQLKPEVVWEIEGGLSLAAAEVAAAAEERSAWYRALQGLFARYDVLALPTAQCFPFAAETHWPREIAGRPMDTYHRWMEVVVGGTLSGCPVVSLPAGFGEQGLPMGLQLIAPMRQDLRLLQIAAAWESASGWTRRSPPGVETSP